MTLVERPSGRATGSSPGRAPGGAATRVLDDHRDPWVIGGLLCLAVAVHVVAHGRGVVVGMDVATQFIPWFGWLGDRLAAGDLPLWDPAVLSGLPAAGDPLSGWGYLPAMGLYAWLPLGAATHAFLVVQVALAATGTYVLARALRLPPLAALAAAVVAGWNGFTFQRNGCCVAFTSVEAWIPWLLLGIERALTTTGARRVGAWAVAGLALSQVAGGWLGQGTLYVLVLAGAWLVARALALPGGWRARWRTLVVTGAGLAVAGAGLAAAAVLPRLQVNPATNLAGGYPGQSLTSWHGGWWPADWVALALPGTWHVGVVPLALAVVALIVGRRDPLVRGLGAILVAALLLTLPTVTPVNAPLFLVPGMDRVLTHAPQRALLIAYPVIALLVGVAVARARPVRSGAPLVALLLVVAVAGELAWANVHAFEAGLAADRNPELLRRIDPDTFYDPSSAGRFLQRQRDRGELGRYAAFTPVRRGDGRVVAASYFFFWQYPSVQLLEAHNESIPLGLEHVQGYNPTHLARYDDLVEAANRGDQDYHVANLYPSAFDRGLFDLLNGRWVVLNRSVDHRDPGLVGRRMATWPVVFRGRQSVVLENPDALPRAWVVHDVRRVTPGAAVAPLLDGDVDPRATALVEVEPPPVDAGARATARVVDRGTDRLTVEVDGSGAGLLVLSEPYHTAWRAAVDGRPADVLVTDHVLRGVPVPAGRHTVELRFDPTVTLVGVGITLATALGLALAGWWLRRRRRVGAAGRP